MCKNYILIGYLFLTTTALGQQTEPLTLSGSIVDFNANPIVGAEVVVYEEVFYDDKDVAKVMTSIIKTDRQGRFEIYDNINTRSYSYIVARKPGLAMAWDKVNRYGITKGTGRIILMLDKPGKLSGIVVDHNGHPVSNVTVQTVPKTTYLSRLEQDPIVGPNDWFQTQTDSKGVFSFNSFSHDVSSDFRIKAPKLKCTYIFTTHPQSCCGFEVGRPNIKLALPRETSVQGRVVEAETGRPIEGVKLAIQARRQRNIVKNLYITRIVTSGKDGRFVCEGLPEGKSTIELATEEQQKSQWAMKKVTIDIHPDSPNDDIQVTVEKGGFIELSVQEEETNRPLSDFFARVWGENALYILGPNPSGKVRFCVLPGEYKVNFWHKEPYSSWFANDPVIVEAGKTSQLPITMEKVLNIAGKIIDPDGEPAAGIIVTASPYGEQVYTDKNGVFQTMDSKKECNIIAQDFKKGLVAVHHVKDISESPSIRLKPGLTVTGEIIDSNGIGILAARVCFHGHKVFPEVLTDTKGCFEIRAIPPIQPSFEYRLSVYASGFAPKTYRRISLENEHENTFKVKTIQLEPANMSMSGIVVDANDVPAPGVILFVHGVDGADQTLQLPHLSTQRRDAHRLGIARADPRGERLRIRHQVQLVEHVCHLGGVDVEGAQDLVHDLHVLLPVVVRGIDHVEQDVGVGGLLEGGAEARHQMVGQLADEPDGVHQPHAAAAVQRRLTRERVERREQPVLDERLLAGERGEQARLAGVGVADERGGEHRPPAAADHLAVARDVLQLALDRGDLAPDHAAVGLDLRLTRPSEPDAAADAREVHPHPGQARQQVLELRQLDLQLGLLGLGARREDVQDQLRPVHDAAVQLLLEVLALRGRQLVVEHEEGRLRGGHLDPEFLQLALAEVLPRVGGVDALDEASDDLRAGRVGEARQLLEVLLGVHGVGRAAAGRADEEGALDGLGDLDHAGGGWAACHRKEK